MRKKMLVLDIDGTLTNSRRQVSPATRDAMDRIRRMGHLVVIASGRPIGGMRMIRGMMDSAAFDDLLISDNGACATRAATGKTIFSKQLPGDALDRLCAYARDNDLGMGTYLDCDMLFGNRPDIYIEREQSNNRFGRRMVGDFSELSGTPFYKAVLTAEPERAARHEKILAERFADLSIFRSEPYFIDAQAAGVNKGSAMEALMEALGIPREDVIACGDGYNDLSMLRCAGIGVAMGNAQEAVKQAADIVTGTNDEDGLVPVIERYILNG